MGQDKAPLREAVIHHSINGLFAIRQGKWKLEFCPGSGGWGKPGDADAARKGLPSIQLYDMTADVGEKSNVQSANAPTVERMTKLLEKYVADGRSTPGAPQKNDVSVEVHKEPTTKPAKGEEKD